ncbi:MAG: sugar transferase [Actinomycetota bacterium]
MGVTKISSPSENERTISTPATDGGEIDAPPDRRSSDRPASGVERMAHIVVSGHILRAVMVGADLAAVVAAVGLATLIERPAVWGLWALPALVVGTLIFLATARLYQSRFITRRSDEIRRIGNAVVRAAAALVLVAFVFGLSLERQWLFLATAYAVVLIVGEREIARAWFVRRRSERRLARKVVLVGANSEGNRFAEVFGEQPALGYDVVETVDPISAHSPRELTSLVLAAARRHQAHGVVVAATAIDMGSSNRLIRDLVEAGLHVELSSTLADISFDRLTVRPLGPFPVVYIEPRRRHGWRASAKRVFDLSLAATASMMLAPVFVAVALAVRMSSPGPVLFRQERVGHDGEPFEVLKFRTMVVGAEAMQSELSTDAEDTGPLFKMKHDPRVTRVGSFLRKTSLDELPQLWNVVRNEMSLVGPRPALRSEMSEWSDDLYARLRVKPGITGMWQVSGRSSTTFAEYTRLDLYYVDNWSLIVDLSILVRTIPAVLKSRGAY